MNHKTSDQYVIGWRGSPRFHYSHYYQSRYSSTLAVAECGQIEGKRKLEVEPNLAHCQKCVSGLLTPELRLRRIGGY